MRKSLRTSAAARGESKETFYPPGGFPDGPIKASVEYQITSEGTDVVSAEAGIAASSANL